MKYCSIDKTLPNIVIIRINPIEPTPAVFDEYILEMKKLIKDSQQAVLVHNVSQGKFLTSEQRIKIGNLYKEQHTEFKSKIIGHAFVNSSFIQMTILKGIFLVNRPPVDYVVVSSEQEAVEWARRVIEKSSSK